MHRFLVSFPLRDKLILTRGDLFHQITHVFRAKKGEKMIFFISGGVDTIYEIGDISKREILFKKCAEIPKVPHKRLELHVFQAYPNKISTMELIVQKLVELGVKKITFFPSEHSQIQIIPVQKQERIVTIAKEALEQSGGNEVVDIAYSSEKLQIIIPKMTMIHHIFGHQAGESLNAAIVKQKSLALWIGPEGGWSSSETSFLSEQGTTLWSFNDNVLRLETAAILGAGILFYSQNLK